MPAFTMPDVRNLSETAARDAILAAFDTAGITDTTVPLAVSPAVYTGIWDDHVTLGELRGSGQTADTVGADGSVSWQRPTPGSTVTVETDHSLTWTLDAETSFTADQFLINVWGVTLSDIPDGALIVTLASWATSPELMGYPAGYVDTAPLTTGPWTIADWEAGSSFRIELWTLHTPDAAGTLIGEVTQFGDISVKEALNDQTELRFTISMHDPLAAGVGAYTQAAKVFYRNQIKPVYYAPVTFTEDYDNATVTITGVNVIRLQHHFVRRLDAALNQPDDEGAISMDGSGYAKLLNAAENTDEQDVRNVPSLGILLDSRDSGDDDLLIGVTRGDNVWQKMQDVAANVLGRDFEFDPQADVTGIYMAMRIWNRRGSDRTATVRYYYGVSDSTDNPDLLDNVSAVTATPLQPITHAHVLDDERTYRVTAADAASSEARGIFVEWVQSDLKVHKRPSTKKPDLRPLSALAQATVDAYATAPRSLDLTLRPDAGQDAFYREHFWPGDTVWVQAAKGYRSFEGNYRIRDVEISEPGWRGMTVTKLGVVPDIAADELDEDA